MSFIMELIGPELSKLSALEFENVPYLTVYSLASANIDQSVPKICHNIYAHKVLDEFDYGSN